MTAGRMNRPCIVNHVYGSAERTLFDPTARDNCTEPYIKLRRHCENLGYRFEPTRDQALDYCEWFLFWDAAGISPERWFERMLFGIKARVLGGPTRDLFREVKRAGMRDRLVLLVFEPPTVCPRNYDRTVHDEFAVIFTCDPGLVDGDRYHRIYFPNPTECPKVARQPWARKKLVVDISGYKFSTHERELFTERRQLVRFFELHYPDQFDLYGEGWNMTLHQYWFRRLRSRNVRREFFPSYRGPVRHKREVYPFYRFGICYENINDQPGYVTLKIFDCMRAGCTPVYFGAPDIKEYVDEKAFVDRRDFKSNEELGKYLAGMSEAEHERYLEAAAAYLETPKFKLFLSENFVDTIVRVLDLKRRG